MVQAVSTVTPAMMYMRGSSPAGQPADQGAAQTQAAGNPAAGVAAPSFALPRDASGAASKALEKMLAPLIPADARLAISEDQFISRFIYKFIDPSNGHTVRQYPRPMLIEALHAMEAGAQRFLDERA